MVTATGNAGETSDFTVVDSSANKTGKVDVYGMASGMYVVLTTAKATIAGGTWTNYPCETCGASNIFIYPSHGATLEITGGTFEQKGSDYLLGWMGSSQPTNNNSVGVDYDQTKVVITGGTFVDFNPAEVKFFDTANSGQETINSVPEEYAPQLKPDGTWGIVDSVAKIGTVGYATFEEAIAAAQAGDEIILNASIVITEDMTLDLTGLTVNGNGMYPAFGEAYF